MGVRGADWGLGRDRRGLGGCRVRGRQSFSGWRWCWSVGVGLECGGGVGAGLEGRREATQKSHHFATVIEGWGSKWSKSPKKVLRNTFILPNAAL